MQSTWWIAQGRQGDFSQCAPFRKQGGGGLECMVCGLFLLQWLGFEYNPGMEKLPIKLDVVIFGGGVAGLWALNRLRKAGYQAILLENRALGSGQTMKSQGIIHGGLKYALTGFLNASANAVEAMPKRWKECLAGRGEIDLASVHRLSDEQLLWSTGSLISEMASFLPVNL